MNYRHLQQRVTKYFETFFIFTESFPLQQVKKNRCIQFHKLNVRVVLQLAEQVKTKFCRK